VPYLWVVSGVFFLKANSPCTLKYLTCRVVAFAHFAIHSWNDASDNEISNFIISFRDINKGPRALVYEVLRLRQVCLLNTFCLADAEVKSGLETLGELNSLYFQRIPFFDWLQDIGVKIY
jgi:hypothetical protein